MHRRLTLGLALGAAMLLMSCSGAPLGSDGSTPDFVTLDASQPTTTQPATAWLGTNPPGTTLPDTTSAKCDRIGSRVINEFVASFNDGVTDLDPYFASGEEFQWYSDDQRWDGHRRLGGASVHCGLGQINVWSLGTADP